MLKKVGLVTIGAAATLAAVAPIASATGTHEDGPKHHGGGKACAFNGGEAGAASEISGDALLGNVVAQAPIAGNNIANLANCSDFLNHNLNDNLSGNTIAIL
ncbi:hypothetical protein [Pseudonocardia endophytica]|uniref:Small secreted domain DUF320 n=1 Tax=Pseudonocardia endophytica TaxID=401976 RepID=A0A4R1I1K1_PSEEN|nr:hypothetical protein [Pseudonocardia endophytica]TCK27793.1 hypothetical protein EV378_3672 [Pseudonocardia endophytica]